MKALMIVSLLAAFCLTGCPKNEVKPPAVKPPAACPAPKPIPDQLRGRKSIAESTDQELEARAIEDQAIGEIADNDREDIEREQQNRWVRGWSKWSFRGGFAGVGLGIVAFFLILWLAKSLKWAVIIGGALAGLGVIGFAFCQIMAHWTILLWVAGILLLLFLAAVIWYLVDDHVAGLVDALKTLFKNKEVDLASLEGPLSEAVIHNKATLAKLLTKIGIAWKG